MVRTLEQTEFLLQAAKARVAELQAERDALVTAAHVVTAADFRITIEGDDGPYTFDDIIGDCADHTEKQDPASFYARAYRAYHFGEGNGVYAFGVVVHRLDVATGEYEPEDSCWGYFSLDDWPDQDTLDSMMEFAAACLPEGIDIKDIEGAK